ncbi:recQ-mediated genome instability protein 1 isoform X1 [Syzygium oleosum]|uniref:recQ-mediated genome instability protein 1 isoform X1 n=1 Tax=Syzygium oleosum TaxID=219896 RepID=UPI0011D24081|nr:recQ-mediated genome instability protein 1 isoform X1 [Syzygium oleosum]
MRRRRLRLACSSSSDDDDDENGGAASAAPDPTPHPPVPPAAVEISDDEVGEAFIDVSESLSSPSHSPPPPPPPTTPPSPVAELLQGMGLRLRREWLDSCLDALRASLPHFSSLDPPSVAKLCFQHFLLSDMNSSGAGVLPPDVHAMHLAHLPGPFVLQVDEIVNISCPLRGRYQNAPAGLKRCLKLSMTDGVQRVFGMEYRPLQDLHALAPSGFKIALCNVHIRHGLLMLVPEALEVLGGVVDELEAARQRLVEEVNKPPRGRRTRSGATPSLANRATLAAWSPNVDDAAQNGSVTAQDSSTSLTSRGINLAPTESGNDVRSSVPSAVPASVQDAVPSPSPNFISEFEEMHVDAVPMSNMQTASRSSTNVAANSVDSFSNAMPYMVSDFSHGMVSSVEELDPDVETLDRAGSVPNPSSDVASYVHDIEMVDEIEHPRILSGDRESPFTYLASLSTKWAAMKDKASSVQGKVKCFLTGVKGFQYKQRTTYELQVYVDDGSLISDILISNNVVLKGIGHSPEEVTAALSSTDKTIVSAMKETLRKFQYFLVNFEGIMLVEINGTSPFPIAIEMDEGCNTSDAWQLLRRLKSFTSAQE